VIEQLVDWNLELTEAATPADRDRIFADKHEKLKVRIGQAKLSDTDRELAENLLTNGVWLVKNDDPVEELNRFHRVADRLLEKMQHAADKADASQSERMASAASTATSNASKSPRWSIPNASSRSSRC
jgi:hypothetical protein